MVGAVIVAHCSIGKELIATAEHIVGSLDGVTSVSIGFEENAFEARKRVSQAIRQVDEGGGVILLTDLFGGSPSNIALSFLNEDRIEVVSGVNLPMILTFWSRRPQHGLHELAKQIRLSGTRGIARAMTLRTRDPIEITTKRDRQNSQ